VHEGRMLLCGEPAVLLDDWSRATRDIESAPSFETLFLARLEQAEHEHGGAKA
jgi:hypothetical protein